MSARWQMCTTMDERGDRGTVVVIQLQKLTFMLCGGKF